MDWVSEYIRLIGCTDPKELQIEAAMQLKDRHIPAKLFKYFRPTNYALDNLRTGTVWMNRPAEYNDPFEFAEHIDFAQLQDPINDAARYTVPAEVQYILESSKEINAAFHGVMEKLQQEVQQQANANMQQRMIVCSFCESHEQLLMWSHYTEKHTGFCVEYDIEQWHRDDIRRRIIYPVIYQDNRYNSTPHLIHRLNNQNDFNPLYTLICGSTKSNEWRYEKEWRLNVNFGESFKPNNYPMHCQSKVYLGCRMKTYYRKKLLRICRKNNLPVFLARPANDKFGLEFEQIVV